MCCDDRLHLIVVSTVWLILTSLSAICSVVWTVLAYTSESYAMNDINHILGGNFDVVVGIQAVIHIFWIISAILSIVGAQKNSKWLLVPFMIGMIVQIIFYIICIIYVVHEALFAIFIFPLLIPLVISFYFATISIRFHAELSYGGFSGAHTGMALKSYTAPPYCEMEQQVPFITIEE